MPIARAAAFSSVPVRGTSVPLPFTHAAHSSPSSQSIIRTRHLLPRSSVNALIVNHPLPIARAAAFISVPARGPSIPLPSHAAHSSPSFQFRSDLHDARASFSSRRACLFRLHSHEPILSCTPGQSSTRVTVCFARSWTRSSSITFCLSLEQLPSVPFLRAVRSVPLQCHTARSSDSPSIRFRSDLRAFPASRCTFLVLPISHRAFLSFIPAPPFSLATFCVARAGTRSSSAMTFCLSLKQLLSVPFRSYYTCSIPRAGRT